MEEKRNTHKEKKKKKKGYPYKTGGVHRTDKKIGKKLLMVFLFSIMFIGIAFALSGNQGTFINSFDTSSECAGTNPETEGVTTDNVSIWIVCEQSGAATIFKYWQNGTYTGINEDVESEDTQPRGIKVKGEFVYVIGQDADSVYKYHKGNLTYTDASFPVNAQTINPWGIEWDGNWWWIIDFNNQSIYQYHENWTTTGFTFAVTDKSITAGITGDGSRLWHTSNDDKEVFRWWVNGTDTDFSFDIAASGNSNPYGMDNNITHFFIANGTGNNIFVYVLDLGFPLITLNTPPNNSVYFNPIIDFGGIVTDTKLVNVSIYIDNILQDTNSSAISGVNYTFTETVTAGNHTWTYEACNSDAGCANSSIRHFSIINFLFKNINYNTTSFETKREQFTFNISTSGGTPTSAQVEYNGTNNTATVTATGGNFFNISAFIDVPTITGAKGVRANFILNSTLQTTTSFNQTISETVFTLCNITYPIQFLNISFKDEGDDTIINASIPSSTFTYYLGSGLRNKTYTFINNTDNFNYDFCATPNETMSISPFIQYKKGTTYPQRTWNPVVQNYTPTTINQTLYLLGSADGIFVTFQVINSAEQLLEGVEINATRSVGGSDVLVGNGITGASGTLTIWLNPDFIHIITFIKAGFEKYTFQEAPTQRSYTITLGGSGLTTTADYTQGMKRDIYPKGNELINDTTYSFEFNLSSSFWTLDSFGFNLRLKNGTIVGTDSSTVENTAASLSYDVNNQSIIYMDYFWIVEGNITRGYTRWNVINDQYSSWSIKQFITDLNSAIDSGIFGLDEFGRILIVFLILFLAVGITSFKFGFTSPISITLLIFVIVFFLDRVVGLIPDINGIKYLVTYLAGLILAVTIIGEVSR